MRQQNQFDDQTLEKCRHYLKLLASTQVDTWMQQRVDASDLVQQTLLDAVQRRDQFRGTTEGELLAWLRVILSNNLVDLIRHDRRAKRDVARNVSLHDNITGSFRRIDALAASNRSTPSQRVATNEQLFRLPTALEQLSAAQRQAIVLHHLHGRTLSETAAALGRSESAVGGLLHRGLKRLHELMGD